MVVKSPSDESLRKIADKLGPEIYDLLGVARPDPRDKTLVEKFHRLNDVQKDHLLAYISSILPEELPVYLRIFPMVAGQIRGLDGTGPQIPDARRIRGTLGIDVLRLIGI